MQSDHTKPGESGIVSLSVKTQEKHPVDVRALVRGEHAKTVTNLSAQRMFPLVAARVHSIWRQEMLWLPDGSICYTALVALVHERGERAKDWRTKCTEGLRNDMEEEAWFLETLEKAGAISIDAAVFLLVSAHSVAKSDGHGHLHDLTRCVCDDEKLPEGWPSECKPVSKRVAEIEEHALDTSLYDITALLANNDEYRELAIKEAEYAIRYVTRWTGYTINNYFGLPECFIHEAVKRGQTEVNRHIQRERLAIIRSLQPDEHQAYAQTS